jgi:hypothetical protein
MIILQKSALKLDEKYKKKVHILELGFCWPLLVEFYLQNRKRWRKSIDINLKKKNTSKLDEK